MTIPRIPSYRHEDALNDLADNKVADNKVPWQISPERAVLLVHDMQNYFVDFFDRHAEPMTSLLTNSQRLIQLCRAQNIPVVYTAQPPNQKPEHRALLTDFWGPGISDHGSGHVSGPNKATAIVSELTPHSEDRQYTKWRYSAFQRTPLLEDMQAWGRDQLIVCGVYAHIGVLATALEGFMRDIQCFVVADAVADFSAADHRMALNYIATRCGKVEKLKEVTSQRAEQAEHANDASTEPKLNFNAVKKDIATTLGLASTEFQESDNPLDLGLDSIRLMTLVEKWRAQGAPVDFATLAEATTLNEWWQLLNLESEGQEETSCA